MSVENGLHAPEAVAHTEREATMRAGWWFFGMHVFWWIFWVLIIVAFFSLLTPVPKGRARSSALEILQRRYAAGEISTEEYEKRKAVLVRDGATQT